MASIPITSRQIDGEKVEIVTDFILGGSKITVDNDCNHEIKRCLLLGRKAMKNLDSVLKSGNITLLTKVPIISAMVAPMVTSIYDYWKKHSFDYMDHCQQNDVSAFYYVV